MAGGPLRRFQQRLACLRGRQRGLPASDFGCACGKFRLLFGKLGIPRVNHLLYLCIVPVPAIANAGSPWQELTS